MRKRVAGAVLAASTAGAVVVLVVTPFAGGQQPPVAAGCDAADAQPEQPLELNAVVTHRLAKFVAVEKEVFHCRAAGGRVDQIRDVETFVEIVKAPVGKRTATVDRRVDVVECVTNLRSGAVRCRSTELPLAKMALPVEGCSLTRGEYPFDPVQQPSDPLEMATVVIRRTVTTVKVEKQVLECQGRPADVYLFTEIDEAAATVHPAKGKEKRTLAPVAWRFSGIACFKDRSRATVIRCRTFPVT